MGDIGDIVLRTFESARQAPGAPFEPERLLAYLTHPPASGRRVEDTFRGRRRLVRFMESLQVECGICFTNDEWERGLGLAELTRAIEGKLGNRASQARLASKRAQEARVALVTEPVKIGLLTGALLGWVAAGTRSALGYAACGIAWLCVVAFVVTINARGYAYARRLVAVVERTVD